VVNRGSRGEIDVFPGQPLENVLQGNVIDLCPVGALLDKDFLFKQRVWLLRGTKSVSPADSRGQTIWIDWNEEGLHRIRPRYNEKVNEWWISDEARFGWKYVQRPDHLNQPRVRVAGALRPERWEALPALLRDRLKTGPTVASAPSLPAVAGGRRGTHDTRGHARGPTGRSRSTTSIGQSRYFRARSIRAASTSCTACSLMWSMLSCARTAAITKSEIWCA
jgi:hypothetical protein